MASITTDKRGNRRILFCDPVAAGGRRTIALGNVDKKVAASILVHVERLITSKHYSVPLPVETAAWLAGTHPILHGRLVNAGLAEPRVARAAVTLSQIIDTFSERRASTVKASTQSVWKRARRLLCEYFGENRTVESITAADADDFRRHLLKHYAEATMAKVIMVSKAFFRDAARRKTIPESPFADTATGSQRNPDRQQFIDAPTIIKAIDAAPDAQWRLLIALARFGGLRVPSEPLAMRWSDVNWSDGTMIVHSPKTERHSGGAQRVVPIFGELYPYLREAFELNEPGQDYVIHRWRTSAVNLRTQFERILNRAGIIPWPRLWQNLRASRATELVDRFPGHLCAAWLGHTEAVADKHYRQATADHLKAAIQLSVGSASRPTGQAADAKMPANVVISAATQNPTQQPSEMARNGLKPKQLIVQEGPDFPVVAGGCEPLQNANWAIQDSNL